MKIGTTNKIEELAPTISECFDSDSLDDWMEKKDARITAYHERIAPIKPARGVLNKYFLSKSHDGVILELKIRRGKDLCLVLNDVATYKFAWALSDRKGLNVDWRKMKFPVKICSRGTKHVSMNVVDKATGELVPVRFRKMYHYLYDEIISWQENDIEMVFEMAMYRPDDGHPHSSYIVLLACEGFDVEERQTAAWQSLFGNAYDDYYDYFVTKRNEGAFLHEYEFCNALIDEFEALTK